MRVAISLVLLSLALLAAAGCATGLQGLAVLSSMRHGGGQPTFSEFAAEVESYSPPAATAAGIAAWGEAPAPSAEPEEPEYGYVAVSDSQTTGPEPGQADGQQQPAAVEAIDPDAALPAEESPLASPFHDTEAPTTEWPTGDDAPRDDIEGPSADDTAPPVADDAQNSPELRGPMFDEATGYPVAVSQNETGQGEVIHTPQPAATDPRSGDADIDRFNRRLVDVPLDIRPSEGVMPGDPAAARFAELAVMDPRELHQVPGIMCSCTPWTICYRPLYFEEVALERYGDKARCIQPVISGVRFFGTVALLPYKMRVRPPRSCLCSNGFSRPGDPMPAGYCDCVWRWDAAAIELAAVTGFVFILP